MRALARWCTIQKGIILSFKKVRSKGEPRQVGRTFQKDMIISFEIVRPRWTHAQLERTFRKDIIMSFRKVHPVPGTFQVVVMSNVSKMESPRCSG